MSTPPLARYVVLSAEHANLRSAIVHALSKGAVVVELDAADAFTVFPLDNGAVLADAFMHDVKITVHGKRYVRLRAGETWIERAPVDLNKWNDLPGKGQVFLNRKGRPTEAFFPEGADRNQVLREVREFSGYGVRLCAEETPVSLGVRISVEVAFR